ncbi:alpha/beta fold hydrolase [Microbacterium oleivorans]|uniref:alpha/beta fold hydrolase n=1 Tax=Microbacterium oleivorans TaxID=273677 RepID=UPI00203AC38C|nr:alpha/beta fold hydrolase [Microbacterium oleivorans]MCM3695623.1 alpha/beta fold hydrolase [Microbacterium oleivorans]
MRLYVHSTDRDGVSAWPSSAQSDAEHLPLDLTRPLDELSLTVTDAAPRGAVVFAHSAAAVPVALAAARLSPRALVLVEPALYDIARGHPAIEAHIGEISRAKSVAEAGDLFGYWSIVRPLMFGGAADRSRWESERPGAERFATRRPPWGFGVDAAMLRGIATLVVTGGWNAEYDAIADVLQREGARRLTLPGHGHRPQDHPEFAAAVEAFLAGE